MSNRIIECCRPLGTVLSSHANALFSRLRYIIVGHKDCKIGQPDLISGLHLHTEAESSEYALLLSDYLNGIFYLF